MVSVYDYKNVWIANQVQEIREKRKQKQRKSYSGFCADFMNHEWSTDVLRVFLGSVNIVIIVQIIVGVASVYAFRHFNIWFVLDSSLIVSPIVFPLAFAINIDFQRREKILEMLGRLKSSIIGFYFCMREYKYCTEMGVDWFHAIRQKLACFSLNIHEYLITEDVDRRRVLLDSVYEDLSATNEMLWKIRRVNLPNSAPLISRHTQTLNDIMSSFEYLQNFREYRSSRAIRSFNKVMVFILPIILSPYFVHLGNTQKKEWASYYMSIMTVFIFSTLQGVHDKLDNPFDGMGEDDVNMEELEEWIIEMLDYNPTDKKLSIGYEERHRSQTQISELNTM